MLLKPKKKVFTMKEIALAAQVSLSTVYRILRSPGRVSTPVQVQVRSLLIQNGYLPDFHYTSRIHILNVVVPGEYLHAAAMFFALQKVCLERGVGISLCNYDQVPSMIRATNAKGLLFSICVGEKEKLPLPSVVLKSSYTTEDFSSVGEDDVGGMILLFRHLKSLGHRRIFYFYPTPYKAEAHMYGRVCRDNIRGFYTLNDLPYEEELVCFKPLNPESHYRVLNEAADYFLSLKKRPTAIVLEGDIYAEVFYRRLRDAGLRIPEDVSIAGIDNILRYQNFVDQSKATFSAAFHLDPPLTTVDYPLEEIAENAVDLLLKEIENPYQPRRRILLQPEIILTNSIGKAKGKI